MIFVDRASVPVPEFENSDRQADLTESLGEYFRSSPQERQHRPPLETKTLATAFLGSLRSLFHDKCAFSERVTIYHPVVTHLRPPYDSLGDEGIDRESYWWAAYRWSNAYLAHPRTVLAKGNSYPVTGPRAKAEDDDETALLLDPCRDDPNRHLRFAENGFVYPVASSDLAKGRFHRGEMTITLLELNEESLVRARASKWKEFASWWKPELKPQSYIHALANTQEYAGMLRQCVVRRMLADPERGAQMRESSTQPYFAVEGLDSALQNLLLYDVIPDANDPTRFGERFADQPTVTRWIVPGEGEIVRAGVKSFVIERVKVRNFRGIDRIELFVGPSQEERQENESTRFITAQAEAAVESGAYAADLSEDWQVLLGENASGKSSLLQAIAAALCWQRASDLSSESDAWWRKLQRRNARTATEIELFFRGVSEPYRLILDSESSRCEGDLPGIGFVRGYGSTRLSGQVDLGKARLDRRVKNLYDPWCGLVDPIEFLLSLDPNEEFPVAAQIICRLLLFEENVSYGRLVQNHRRKTVTIDGVPIDLLSDGYRGILVMACDLLTAINAPMSDYRSARGIALVDELGVNLHPRWRMRIVPTLRDLFPRVQFIASTHEPLCLRGLRKGEIARIWRNQKSRRVGIQTDLPSPHSLRVDQLLTSPIFGLFSSLDPKLEIELAEYYELLSKSTRDDQEVEQMHRLRNRIFGANTLGNSRREQLMYLAIDRLLAEKGATESDETLADEAIEEIRRIWQFEGLDDYF